VDGNALSAWPASHRPSEGGSRDEVVWGGFLAFFLTLLFPRPESCTGNRRSSRSSRRCLVDQRLGQRRAFVHAGHLRPLRASLGLASSPGTGVGGGADAVVLFVTGYLLEWSLSVDNIFVIAPDFLVPEDSRALPVRRAVLGHRRRDRAARVDDRNGHGALAPLRLDVLRVRRDPADLGICACCATMTRCQTSARAFRRAWCGASCPSPRNSTAARFFVRADGVPARDTAVRRARHGRADRTWCSPWIRSGPSWR